MRFISLASSSKGNCYIVSDGSTQLMIEAGISEREIKKRIAAAGCGKLSEISAALITHSHKDHSRACRQLLDNGMTVYASQGTADEIGDERPEIVKHGELFRVGSFDIMPFNTFHNTREPLGYLIKSRRTREKLLFAIDTVNMYCIVPELDYIAIECNYIESKLAGCTKLHDKVREHIANTHLELGTLLRYMKKLDLSKVKKVYLTHLSGSHSSEAGILQAFAEQFPELCVEICPE